MFIKHLYPGNKYTPKQKTRKLSRLSKFPLVVDNLQEWEVIPHRASATRPTGVSALFGDGHVNFCTGSDLFDNDVWPRKEGYLNGPGNDEKSFVKLLGILRNNHQ